MQLFEFRAYILIKGVATMVVKINGKPIRVSEDDQNPWYREVNWMYILVSTLGYVIGLYVMDYVAWVFLGTHPFPFIKFIGVILSWLG